MDRRKFLKTSVAGGVGAAAAASAFPAPAIAQNVIEWRMVMSWPKTLPGLGTGAARLAERINTLTDGRMRVQVFGAGELVPALEGFQAVSDGTADMCHDASDYHMGKTQAAAFFTAVPFGMTAQELNAWIYHGGGQELWDEAYEPFGLKAFLAGNTGCQMGGWFRREVKSIDDFRGLKFRMPGQGGEVLKKVGATVVLLPAGELFQALQSGALDALEWVGPYNDLALGFHQVAKYYYWPGFHEPGSGLECIVNKAKYEALPSDLQAIVAAACAQENDYMFAELNWYSGPALQSMIQEHGVQLRNFPRDVMIALGTAAGEVMQEVLDTGDDVTKRVAQSFLTARKAGMAYTRITDQGYANARLLPFNYPG